MKKVKVKHPDIFQLAHAIVEAAIDESLEGEDNTKNPQAVASGRLGGKKASCTGKTIDSGTAVRDG